MYVLKLGKICTFLQIKRKGINLLWNELFSSVYIQSIFIDD